MKHMVSNTTVTLIGFLIVIIPQLGFPSAWQRNITSALGVLVVLLGIRLMRTTRETPSGAGDTFVEKSAESHTTPEHESRG
jgi:uncharacterized membrane protein YqgA involved in biofilm formation